MDPKRPQPQSRHMLVTYGCMALWIGLSAGVIMFNKYILDPKMGGFPFPLTLTAVHMAFCSVVSWALIRLRLVEAPAMPIETYLKCVVPVGALFAVTLWMGNAAYMYLSVSFIQMLKAAMPMLVYVVGNLLGTEKWSLHTGCILMVVAGGVLTASYGEVVFVALGVLYQCASLLSEATRLTLVQLLLQARGIKLNPISTMYHVSPVCLGFLVIPLAVLEAEKVFVHDWRLGPSTLIASAAAAFALNCAIFLVIGKTSALTMNIAGVVKDVLLICLSMSLYGSIVTELQFVGYAVALSGVFYYNYQKIKASSAPAVKLTASSGGSSSGQDTRLPGEQLRPVSGPDLEQPGGGTAAAAAAGSGSGERDPLVTRSGGSRGSLNQQH